MASVKYERVTKSFGDLTVIKGVDLDIRDGELVVFVGPSGCGKSTLLRMMAGLEEADGGNLYIGEKRVNDILPKNRNIAMVFQNYALFPHMTLGENIGFGLKIRGVNKKERAKAVAKVAEILGLEKLLDRQPRALSGGQRQRAAMGRAIVRDPAVFLMDEPLSNLDAKLRTQMRIEIKKLQRRLKTTTIFVTHDQVEAMTLADRIAVLHDGRVQQFGTPAELYASPVNKFVAGFLGSPAINFIRADHTGKGELSFPDGQIITLPKDQARAISGQKAVEIGIRPEQIKIVKKDTAPADGIVNWSAKVTLAESLGGEALVYTSHGGHEVTLKVANRFAGYEGADIHLAFDIRCAHLFAVDGGQCLVSASEQ
ncbi:MAG: sugar ABC transporter ATP-binding protein [Deltaproteobacteria bacterium]|nr:MAG: sugar ABC transporter ATP-binding protein [Deltaproteobacteria bacterium]